MERSSKNNFQIHKAKTGEGRVCMSEVLQRFEKSHDHLGDQMLQIWRDKQSTSDRRAEEFKDLYCSTMYELKSVQEEDRDDLKPYEAKISMLISEVCAKLAAELNGKEKFVWYSRALSHAHRGIRLAERFHTIRVEQYSGYAARQARWAYNDTNQNCYLSLWVRHEKNSKSENTRFLDEATDKLWDSIHHTSSHEASN
jgi:hypothetical protein